jgi:hypothetical protein
MRRSFDNFAIVDGGLANNRNNVPYLNISGTTATPETPFGTPLVTDSSATNSGWGSWFDNTPTTPYSTAQGELVIPPTYTSGQQTSSGGFLSNLTAQELNTLGQTVGGLTAAILQIRQQSQQAQTQEEQLELQRQAQELERQRIEAMNALADAQRRAGVPVTAGGQGLSTGAIVGIVAGGVLVLGLILFLAFRPKN